MRVFALSDPHLAFGTPGKEMDRFGVQWVDHARRIAANWREQVADDDLVLVTGDISWAMRLERALPDLEFLAQLPGQKVLLRGNHDYWWSSLKKVRAALPPRMFAVDGDVLEIGPILVGGTRLWDTPGLSFATWIQWAGERNELIDTAQPDADSLRIYRRELQRLERAMQELARKGRDRPHALRVAITHYPPCGAGLEPTAASQLIENAGAVQCVFGHLHAVRQDQPAFGSLNGVEYHLASCDYLGFRPKQVAEVGG